MATRKGARVLVANIASHWATVMFFERCGLEDAGVVDEDVEPAELLDDRGDGLVDALGIAEVAANGERVDVLTREVAHGLFRLRLRGKISDGDVCAGFGQGEGDGAANALGRSGDERGLCPVSSLSMTWVLGDYCFGVASGAVSAALAQVRVRGGGRAGVVGRTGSCTPGFLLASLALVVCRRRPAPADGAWRCQMLSAGLVDLVVLGVGGETSGDDLHAYRAAGRDDVDDRLAVGVGLDLEVALVLAVHDGVEDDGGVHDGLAVELLETRTSIWEVGGGALYLRPRLDGVDPERKAGQRTSSATR